MMLPAGAVMMRAPSDIYCLAPLTYRGMWDPTDEGFGGYVQAAKN